MHLRCATSLQSAGSAVGRVRQAKKLRRAHEERVRMMDISCEALLGGSIVTGSARLGSHPCQFHRVTPWHDDDVSGHMLAPLCLLLLRGGCRQAAKACLKYMQAEQGAAAHSLTPSARNACAKSAPNSTAVDFQLHAYAWTVTRQCESRSPVGGFTDVRVAAGCDHSMPASRQHVAATASQYVMKAVNCGAHASQQDSTP